MKVCEYEQCGRKVFAIERVTGTDMPLCFKHFINVFGKLAFGAEVRDLVDRVDDEDTYEG